MLNADEIIRRLALKPLPREGGYFRETHRSASSPTSTAIYYLLTVDTFSAMHRLPGDEVYHFYQGDPVELLRLDPDGTGEIVRLGSDLTAGQRPQCVVPGGCWQGSRVTPGGTFALMGTTMAPGFDPADYRHGDRDDLTARYPTFAGMIDALTRAD